MKIYKYNKNYIVIIGFIISALILFVPLNTPIYAIDIKGVKNLAVIDPGSLSRFDRNGGSFLANPEVWSRPGEDGDIKYNMLRPGREAKVFFTPFGVDKNGFCNSDMVLEVIYRDDIGSGSKDNIGVESRLDYTRPNQYFMVGSLRMNKTGRWKQGLIFFERTPWQMIRAIDGYFRFKLVMPDVKQPVPVSMVSLYRVSHEEFVKMRDEYRTHQGRGLKRINFSDTDSSADKKESDVNDFVTYPVFFMKPVFPDSPVPPETVGKGLHCEEITGYSEPVSFVLHSFKKLDNVSVDVTNLTLEGNKIRADNINVRRVHYNDQRWGWMTQRRYGRVPDYLGFSDPVLTIKAGTNTQYWLTIKVPDNAVAGTYSGKVRINVDGELRKTLPLTLKVFDIKVLDEGLYHMVFHSPFMRDYHPDPKSVLLDMKEHGLVPIFYPPSRIIKTADGLGLKADRFGEKIVYRII